MKVQVNLKIASQNEATSKVDFTVNGEDTVQNVKQLISASQMLSFPDPCLVVNGKALNDKNTLTECGVQEGTSMDFVMQASESFLIEQITELLQARDLTCDELGLLYCYKHGISINQALKVVGYSEKFQDFIKKEKKFMVENGRVALVRSDTALKPFSAADELKRLLEESSSGSMDITGLCSRFTQKFNVSIQSIVNMRPAEFLAKEKDLFVVTGRGQVALKSVAATQQRQPRMVRHQQSEETQAAERPAAKVQQVEEKARAVEADSEAADNEQYMDLHNKISGRSFNSKIAQILTDIVDTVTEKSFLNISQVVRGGSVGKGTAITGATDAEVVFFLKGLPHGQHSKWLPSLLKAVAGVLTQHLDSGVEGICTTTDSVHMKVKGLVEVDLRFSPEFESYPETIQAMGEQGPETRRHFTASLSKEKVQFVAKQPGQVKVTMRLLKWWRDQQDWSSAMMRPSDEMLEVIAVYSALHARPKDQRSAIASSMSLMARFTELRVVWSNYYNKGDVWQPLMQHRSLLMDPVNPFVNVADPQTFDPSELMALAGSTRFFW